MHTITIKDIARKCGVGVSTVSRAMNGHPDINPETRKRILEAIEQDGYVPNNSARNLKRMESDTVAVLVKGLTNLFFADMIEVLENQIERQGFACTIQQVQPHENEIDRALELVKEKRLKGIIFLGGNFNHPKEKTALLGVPFVLCTAGIANGGETKDCAAVGVDDFAESYKMVDYLCRSGHKHIAVIASDEADESIGTLRLKGYLAALAAHGITPKENWIWRMQRDEDRFSAATGYRLAGRLLESGADVTAIYAIADSLAIGVCRALYEAGKSVPEDYSVAGFDGLELGQYWVPGITTVAQPVKEMALSAADLLFDMILQEASPRKKIFEGKLLVRESTRSI